MVELNPPGFMQSLDNHSAYTMRRNTLLGAGVGWNNRGDTIPSGGVHPTWGDRFGVTGSGAGMQVTVGSGLAAIPHSQAFGGLYSVCSDGDVVLNVDAADATQFRRDLVIAEVLDTTDADGDDLWRFRVVKGTDSPSSPAPLPSVPAKSINLAVVNVDPGITTLAEKVDDARLWLATGGITLRGLSTFRPADPPIGTLITDLDDRMQLSYYDGSSYRFVSDNGWRTYTPAVSGFGSATFNRRVGRYKYVAEKTLAISIDIRLNAKGTGSNLAMIGLPATPSRVLTEQIVTGRYGLGFDWFAGVGSILASGSGPWIDRIRFPRDDDADLDSLTGADLAAGSDVFLQGVIELA